MNKYIIVRVLVKHAYQERLILFDNRFWHENMTRDEVVSAGFFYIGQDIEDGSGFRVYCKGGAASGVNNRPQDADIIKSFLRGI